MRKPSPPKEGDMFMDSNSKKFFIYENGGWREFRGTKEELIQAVQNWSERKAKELRKGFRKNAK
jgi:hypothetical protein